MFNHKNYQQRISLVAGIILLVATLLVGIAVFIVMQRQAEVLLSNRLQSSLRNRIQLTQIEISSGFDKTMLIATRPLLIEQMQRMNAGVSSALAILNKSARALLSTGLTGIVLFDRNGHEVAHAGTFALRPALTVPLNFPGHVQLIWDGQLLLHAVVDMRQSGQVVGQVMTEMPLPMMTRAFKDARRLGETGELALCAPLGDQMQCFPTTRHLHVMTLSQLAPDGDPLPMAHALAGKTGLFIDEDYRHQMVVAAYAPIDDLGPGMVLKMDSAELYASVWHQLRYLIPLVVIVLIVVLLLLRWLLTPLVTRLVRTEAEAERRNAALTQEIAEHRHAQTEMQHFKNVLDNTRDIIFMFAPDTLRFVYLNQGAILGMGYSREELLNMAPYQLRPLMAESEFRQLIAPLLSGEQSSLHYEAVHRRKDGSDFPVDIFLQLVVNNDGSRLFVAVVRDMTARKKTEDALQLSAMVYQSSSEAMLITDNQGAIVSINPAFTQVTGYTLAEVVGRNPSMLSSGRQDHDFYQAMWREINTTGHWQGEICNLRKNGEPYFEWITINAIYHKDGSVHRYIALFSDITQKKALDQMIWRQANFDMLTGLPNRHMFYDRLALEIKQARRANLPMALLFIDLDHFKEVNDSLGHNTGDILLVEAARRIQGCVRESDMVARLGGDEFIILLAGLQSVRKVDGIAQNILDQLVAPFQFDKERAFISASIGITIYPDDATDADVLLKNVDQAMYAAKAQGRHCYQYFTFSLQETAKARMQITNDLHDALLEQQFHVLYQPIVTLSNGAIHKAEALIRWQHPTRGVISPAEFIFVAEETGLIADIGDWVFRVAVSQAARWRAACFAKFQISINVSPVQFHRDGTNFKAWLDYLQALDLPGQNVVVEITEGLLLDANLAVTDQLLAFRDAGIRVSLDDFGTGYSSLSYLKKFDIDYLKIDQSFVRDLANNPNDMALCEAIIVMAHKLGLEVIAEGVETEQQRILLATAGCDYGQGYLFSKPIPAEEFETLLKKATGNLL